jgi:hypothetical protein
MFLYDTIILMLQNSGTFFSLLPLFRMILKSDIKVGWSLLPHAVPDI